MNDHKPIYGGQDRMSDEDGELVVQECRLPDSFGYVNGEVIHNSSGRAWRVLFHGGTPWAVRTPEHDETPNA